MPLLLRSNRLCVSCFFLFTSLVIAFCVAISPSIKCLLFRAAPYDPIRSPLFSYPSSYGEHKHVLPTFRSSCSSPVFFSGKLALILLLNFVLFRWILYMCRVDMIKAFLSDYPSVFKEIQQYCQDWTDLPLSYMQGKAATFGGNFSIDKRVSFFDQLQQRTEFPCGFFKPFTVNDYG